MKNVTHAMMMLALSATLALATENQPPTAYRLRPGDQVIFSLARGEGPATQFQIKLDNLGQLDLPQVTPYAETYTVRASGRTVDEIAAEVQALVAQHSPGAQVRLETPAAATAPAAVRGMVTFCGEVQGVVFLERQINTHLAQAIHFLGPSRFANLHKVRVSRTLTDGTTQQLTVDVEKIMADGYQQDIPLQPGDIVSVPASHWPGRKPVTDKPAIPADQLKLFCALSHGKPLPVRARASSEVAAAPAAAPSRVSQLAAR